MSNQRRKLIKGLGLGAAWSTPVIQAVVLPAHAQTSVTTEAPCNAPARCYPVAGSQTSSFDWPGEGGVQNVNFYTNNLPNCRGTQQRAEPLALARSEEEARMLLGVNFVEEIPTDSALPGGCGFYRGQGDP